MSATAAPPVPAPVHGCRPEAPLGAVTAFKLRAYRSGQLEMAAASFGTPSPVSPVRGDLQARLDETAEQDGRKRIAATLGQFFQENFLNTAARAGWVRSARLVPRLASLALGRPARVPILTHLNAIGTELARRGAGAAEPARWTS